MGSLPRGQWRWSGYCPAYIVALGFFFFFRFLPTLPPNQSIILIETLLSEFISSNSHSDQHLASFPKAFLRHKVSFLRNMSHCGQIGLSQPGHIFSGGPCLGPVASKSLSYSKGRFQTCPLRVLAIPVLSDAQVSLPCNTHKKRNTSFSTGFEAVICASL